MSALADKWRPTVADFLSEGGIEYFPVEPDNGQRRLQYAGGDARLLCRAFGRHEDDLRTATPARARKTTWPQIR